MMEQLAERRMAREEDATHYPNDYSHGVNSGLSNPHNHPPPEEDEYGDEEEEDEEYESQEDDYEEEEEEVISTEPYSHLRADECPGPDDRRATHGRGPEDVPNLCCPDV